MIEKKDLIGILNFIGDDERLEQKKKQQCKRQKWTPEEEEELKTLFAANFTSKKCPKHKECLKAMKQSKDAKGPIYRKKRTDWETIKKKVYRMVLTPQ